MSASPPRKSAKMSSNIAEEAKTTPTKKSVDELKAEVKKVEKPKIDYQYNELSDGTELKVKKLSANATIPVRATQHSAGFDLFSAEKKIIAPRKHALVKTDISIMIPEGTYGRVAPRSGLAYKKFIDVGAGVIDYDYRGNVGVIIFNHYHEEFPIEIGDKIAQLVVEKIAMPKLVEVEELNETDRGAGGFGSTDTTSR